jgi:hypothetical protein
MKRQGFNIFVLGPPGTGRHAMVMQTLEKKVKASPAPSDLCYVNNFEDAGRPKLLQLSAGQGKVFSHDMETMIIEARNALKASLKARNTRTGFNPSSRNSRSSSERRLKTSATGRKKEG